MYIAKFAASNDLILDAPTPDDAVRLIAAHGIDELPTRLVEVPAGVFVAEVRWADEPIERDEEGETIPNPAADAEGGVVLEPLEALGDYLELEEKTASVAAVVTPGGGSHVEGG